MFPLVYVTSLYSPKGHLPQVHIKHHQYHHRVIVRVMVTYNLGEYRHAPCGRIGVKAERVWIRVGIGVRVKVTYRPGGT